MSKAFGQVTSVLGPAERANASSYTVAYSLNPKTFTEEVEYQAKKRDLDTMFALYARIYARWVYLSSFRGRQRDGERTAAQDKELNRLAGSYIQQLTRAIEQVGTATARDRLGVMRNAIRDMVEDELAQGLKKQAADAGGREQVEVNNGLNGEERHEAERFREPYIFPEGGTAHFRRVYADVSGRPAFYRVVARVYSRLNYLDESRPRAERTDAENTEISQLRTIAGILRDAAPDRTMFNFKSIAAVQAMRNAREGLAESTGTTVAPRAPAAPPPPEPTTRFAPGEVQGEFLLPGGSTLTAEQARLRQLREYVDTLTGEARERANEFLSFYTNIYAPSSSSARWTVIPNQYAYVATMLCPRPDPLGRFLLCDALVDPAGGYDLQLFLAGTALAPSGGVLARGGKGLLLGSGYSNQNLKTINGKQYHRAHTPGGVVVKRVGLGTVLYSAHALVGAVYRGAAGCYSDGGSTSAEVWWREARVRGYAQPSNKFLTKYCAQVAGGRIEEPEESTIVYPKSICADVTALPDAYDRWVDYQTVLKSGLVAFGVVGDDFKFEGSVPFPVKNNHRPFWDTFDVTGKGIRMPGAAIFFEKDGPYTGARSGGIDVLRMELSDETAEMLSRAFHGQSPVLAASIIEALTQSGFDDLAVNYATRADIAPLLAGNATLKRLLESRRLPGVAGLSEARHRRIVKAIGLAGLGQATVDMGEKNPLGFKPLSDKTKRMLAKFKDMD
jgi:hypothetical protein